ncbi:MAG: ATP-grasp domain-containing protein [Sphaerochaetaceae bacterium]
MKIGLTYDLKEYYLANGYSADEVGEFDGIETIKGIEEALAKCNFTVERIGNIKELVEKLSKGFRWPLVFNIGEGLYGNCRESQIPSLLDAYQIPYVFSDTLALALTLHKDLAKMIVAKHNIPTPSFKTIEDISQIERIDITYPLFVKPITGGTGMGIDENALVYNKEHLEKQIGLLLKKTAQPLLIESFLEGREFTVGIVGSGDRAKVIGVMEIVVNKEKQKGIYSYQSKSEYKKWVSYKKVEMAEYRECEKIAIDSWKALGCRDGGRVDLKMDSNGVVNFLEINPLAGLNPIDSDLPILASLYGISYEQLISLIMKEACIRLNIEHEF